MERDLARDGTGAPAGWADACDACRQALGGLPEPGDPIVGPVACTTPFADLGVIAGLHVQVLAIERWSRHATLRIAVGGPAVLHDREPGPLRGRFEVVGADGAAVAGVLGGGGGSELLSIHEVELPPIDAIASPWTVRLHRWDEQAAVVVPGDDLRPLVPRRLVVGPPTEASPSDGACRRCWSEPVPAANRLCAGCLGIFEALGWIQDAMTAMPLADGQPLVADLGMMWAGRLVLVSLERRAGWFTVRYHLGQDWEASTGGVRGRWTAEDDAGQRFHGVETSSSGGPTGWSGDVSFPGCIEPTATQLTISIAHGGRTVLEVDLPLDPPPAR